MATNLHKTPILHSNSLTNLFPFPSNPNTSLTNIPFSFPIHKSPNFKTCVRGPGHKGCAARRRVRYDDDEDEDEDYGHNDQIALLESYTQAATGEALIVHAMVDGEHVEVLVFKGFSSCLSYGTSPDPSRSVVPERATIKSIDRIKGPFDPSNIQYIEKGITWNSFNFPK
ncbi:uncharacterized protein E6C27_scaffold486G001040 [Cucumis melo var. makuwa]|uniref:DUF7734 domain-containing protein n=2 Tax=Cucumis melo TaxID=3656 RepID=A0A5A7UTE4_CUCMM|nr:uncharacterized protein LOC103493452 [Cucumis melo]KAA0056805.1 uncharacterized protein E6C27_scaffold486G001040 [Cucumis melo var. makuwa]